MHFKGRNQRAPSLSRLSFLFILFSLARFLSFYLLLGLFSLFFYSFYFFFLCLFYILIFLHIHISIASGSFSLSLFRCLSTHFFSLSPPFNYDFCFSLPLPSPTFSLSLSIYATTLALSLCPLFLSLSEYLTSHTLYLSLPFTFPLSLPDIPTLSNYFPILLLFPLPPHTLSPIAHLPSPFQRARKDAATFYQP